MVDSTLDLTTSNTEFTNDDGVVLSNIIDETNVGTGVIGSFLSIQDTGRGGGDGIEAGYNTDGSPLPLETTRPQFTNALALSDLTVVTVAGVNYYRFLLDINEPQNGDESLLALTQLRIYLTDAPNQTTNDINALVGNLVYTLPQDVLLDSSLSDGSGNTYDLSVLVPVSLFANIAGANVILFSEFGALDGYEADGTFEEWAAITNDDGGGGGGGGNPVIGIAIDKVTVDGTMSGDGLTILEGESIKWIYSVTNTGNVALTNVTVSDDQLGNVAYLSGDTDNDSQLDVGETWLFQAVGTAISGPYTNTGTATGSYGTTSTSGTNSSSYFGANPGISINKTTSAGALAGDDDYTLLAGTAVTWTYAVTNTGNVTLNGLSVTDNHATITPVYFGGDDGDGLFEAGETWIFTAVGVAVAGDYTNTGTASGSFTDSAGHIEVVDEEDDSGYFGAVAGIAIDKTTTSGTGTGDGLTFLVGSAVTWTYTVTNTGNVALADVIVMDDELGAITNLVSGDTDDDGELDTDETWVFTAIGVAGIGDYDNVGTASGSFTDDAGNVATPDAEDDSSYFGADPSISLVKETRGVNTAGVTNTGDGINIVAGTTVTWLYTLENDGNVDLVFNKLTGLVDDGGPGANFNPTYVSGDVGDDGILGVDEEWVFSFSSVATPGGYANTATATAGVFTDDGGHTITPTDSDDSSYTGIFVADGRARTQGFWQGVADAWDNTAGQANSTLSKFNSGELRDISATDGMLDVNPRANGDGFLMLGDSNRNGVADSGECTLRIDLSVARNILASATTGDARMIMLAQTIAAQLNINNGAFQPMNLIQEAVQWLTGKGAWAGLGVNLDTNLDGIVDANAAKTALAGTSVATSSMAWQRYVDVTQQDATANTYANGEGLKNALMWFNDGRLVTSLPNGTFVGWDADGRGGSTVVTSTNWNTADNFWLTLHQQDSIVPLTGII